MIRENLTAGSPNVLVAATIENGWTYQRRRVPGGVSIGSGAARIPGTAPGWVKLVREGDRFSGYHSPDGTNWTLINSDTFPMAADVFVGLAVTSHEPTARGTGVLSNVTVRPLAPAAEPPTITLTAPAHNSTFNAPADIAFSATAADADGSVAKVDFFSNGQLVGSDTTSPYQSTWSSVPPGTYNLTAVATDDSGATTTSATATVIVTATPANQPPSVSITDPAPDAAFTAPATIAIGANASDGDGTLSRVDFHAGTQLIGTDTTSPYSVTWNDVAAGTYALTAVATDDDGATTSSAAVTVTVNSGPPPPPPARPTRLAFNPSADHQSAVTSYSLAIYRAGDPVTATPAATRDLGKPTPSDNQIVIDISSSVDPLPAGSYYAVVTAIGQGGSAPSSPSPAFSK
jgi:hypothetical protein